MATVTKPIALDESLNTTEQSSRNIADVLAQEIGNLVTVVSRIAPSTTVSWNQIQQSGTKIAQITINGTSTDVYAPTGGGGFSALIIITADAGQTVTATKGGDTYTATEVTSGTYEVTVDSAGTWTISDGTISDTIAIPSSGTYYITLSSVPDGKTVTPTDDVQILLACAGITDKSYTTLTELFADTTTLASVIADNNAIDYLKRSTTFAKSEALVPIMTSDTTPTGYVASASSFRSGNEAYKAFNDDLSWGTYWNASDSGEPQWVQCKLPTPRIATRIRFSNNFSSTYTFIKDFKVYGISGSTPIEIYSGTCANHGATNYIEDFSFSNNTAYDGYRLEITSSYYPNLHYQAISGLQFYSEEGFTDNATAMSYIGLNNYASNTLLADSTWRGAICNSTYFESVLNVKVPTMTSNTTPSGEVIFASNHVTGGQPYYAFDGNNATDYDDYGVVFSTTDSEKYIGYQFTTSVKIYCMDVLSYTISQAGNIRTCTLSAQYDDNGWQTDSTLSFAGSTTPTTYRHIFNAVRNSQKFRAYTTGGNAVNSSNYLLLGIATLQFYGRADV